MDRRSFLSFVSLALAATATSCRRPTKQIVPAHTPAEYSAVGEDVYFSTVISSPRAAYPVRIRTRDFKPIAIVPNPKTAGLAPAPSTAAIASLFALYDPQRFRRPSFDGNDLDLEKALEELFARFDASRQTWIFYRETNSPTLRKLIDAVKSESSGRINFVPLWHASELRLFEDDVVGTQQKKRLEWKISDADTVVVFNSDPHTELGKLIPSRSVGTRVVVLESAVSAIGQTADRRIETMPNSVLRSASDLFIECDQILVGDLIDLSYRDESIKRLAEELCQTKRVAFVASANDYALSQTAFSMNNFFSTMGHGVELVADAAETRCPDPIEISEGDCVLFSECNPEEFFMGNGGSIKSYIQGQRRFSHTLYKPNDAAQFSIDIPCTHYAEHWADTQIFGYGSAIGQPIIEPLNHDSISFGDLLFKLLLRISPTKYSQLSNFYDFLRAQYSYLDRQTWQSTLQNGFIESREQYKILIGVDEDQPWQPPITQDIWKQEYSSESFDSVYFSRNPFLEELEYSNPFELAATNGSLELRSGAFTPSRIPSVAGKGTQWAMAIDLGKCDGCRNCVLSCAFENNIPNAGREENSRDRSMQWLRIEKYPFASAENDIRTLFVPIMCQHCSHAPCESVCPATAVSHSSEGLNETTYNRCVGSRICMANCPYKVRRFNYTDHSKDAQPPLDNMLNPSVTVRSRGVVEKCSFCVQRINRARTKGNIYSGGAIPDGEVTTACAEACPNSAITFGNICDSESAIFKLLSSRQSFQLLGAKETLPNVYYIIQSK